MIVYISPGNTDDKLSQAEWSNLLFAVAKAISEHARDTHGSWFSNPMAPWQNAVWCVELSNREAALLRPKIAELARRYKQDSISWAEVSRQEFLH